MASCLNWLDLNRRVERMLASSSSQTDSLAYTEGDIENMVSEAAHLENVSTEVRALYRDFVEMCVNLRTSVTCVDVMGTVLHGSVRRIGNDGVFHFYIGNLGRSYPYVVVCTGNPATYDHRFCVHARADDPTLAIYDLRSVLSFTEGSRVPPDMQRAPQSLPSGIEVVGETDSSGSD